VLFKAPNGKSSQTSCQSSRWISLEWYQTIPSWKATNAQSNKHEQSMAKGGVLIVQPAANEIVGFVQQK